MRSEQALSNLDEGAEFLGGLPSGDLLVGTKTVRPLALEIEDDAGVERVEAKTMRVLMCLVRRAGVPVTHEELHSAVWSDVNVTDDVIHRAISILRKVFGDDATEQRVIETIPRVGYRLAADMKWVDESIGSTQKTKSTLGPNWSAVGLAVLVVVAVVIFFARSSREMPLAAAIEPTGPVERAEALVREGHLAAAENELRELLRREPEQSTVRARVARIQVRQGNGTGALTTLRNRPASQQDDMDLETLEAYALNLGGQNDKAREVVSGILDRSNQNLCAQRLLVSLIRDQGWQSAEPLRFLTPPAAGERQIVLLYAQAAEWDGQLDVAREALMRFRDNRPAGSDGQREATLFLSSFFLRHQEWERLIGLAEPQFRLRSQPTHLELFAHYAEALFQARELDAAVALLDGVADSGPATAKHGVKKSATPVSCRRHPSR